MIYAECYADIALIESLTEVPPGEIVHAWSKSGVCNKLERENNCLGMVDEDPRSIQPPYMKKLIITEELPEYRIRVLHDGNNNNNIIVLCKGLEDWTLRIAMEGSINLMEYGLPNDVKGLHKKINRKTNEFKKLIADLRGFDGMKVLKKLLER